MRRVNRNLIRIAMADDSGETMVETLVSILISSLALLMLATAIGASVNIVMSSRDRMEQFYNGEGSMIQNAEASSSSSTLNIMLDVALKRDARQNLETTEEVQSYASTDERSGVAMYERSTP